MAPLGQSDGVAARAAAGIKDTPRVPEVTFEVLDGRLPLQVVVEVAVQSLSLEVGVLAVERRHVQRDASVAVAVVTAVVVGGGHTPGGRRGYLKRRGRGGRYRAVEALGG